MNVLKQLADQRTELLEKVDKILDKTEKERRDLTKDEQTEIDWCKRQTDLIEKQRQAEEQYLMYKAGEIRGERNTEAATKVMADVVRSLHTGKPMESRAVTTTGASATIQDPIVTKNLVYALQSNNQLTDAGARFEVMDNNTVYPKVTDYPTSGWYAEGTQISTDSSLAFSPIKWEHRNVAALCVVNDQVLMDSSGIAEEAITQALRRSINDAILKAVFYGDNTNDEPDGLDNITGVQTVDGGSAVISDFSDMLTAYRQLMDANVNPENISMFGAPVAWEQIAGLTATDNQPLMMPDGINEMSKYWTTAVKTDYGVGTDETRLYFGDFSQMVVGFQGAFNFRLVERYKDFLQTGFLIWMRADIQLLQNDNFCRLENISTS